MHIKAKQLDDWVPHNAIVTTLDFISVLHFFRIQA